MRRTPLIFAACLALGASTAPPARAQNVEPPRTLLPSNEVFVTGEGTVISFNIAPVPPSTRDRLVVLRLQFERPDGRVVTVWEGDPVREPLWDGTLEGRLIEGGRYVIIGEVVVDGVPARVRRPVQVDVEPLVKVSRDALPETEAIEVRDVAAEGRRTGRSFGWIFAGAALSVAATSLIPAAIDASPPQSAMRYSVAGAYLGGIALAAWGSYSLWRNSGRVMTRRVTVPIEPNIRGNRAGRSGGLERGRITLRFLDRETR